MKYLMQLSKSLVWRMLWEALGSSGGSGELWKALGGPGRFWEALSGSGMLWDALGGLWGALGGSGMLWVVLGPWVSHPFVNQIIT